MANKLITETSPYLLQHAHNPVDWQPWGDEALQEAKQKDKLILLSIGYSSCHWCHVMERESFENDKIAALMNDNFVCIKVDREERPDLDHIYMEAIQVLSGSGGWPLNVFLTPDLKPVFGGTYFPPVPAHGRTSWGDLLINLTLAFKNQRNEFEEQADKLMGYLNKNNFENGQSTLFDFAAEEKFFTKEEIEKTYNQLQLRLDKVNGGFENAPKFLGTFCMRWLLYHYQCTGEEAALKHVTLTLDKMLAGGIYDQIGGGISRYSTDEKWLVPHFEKMLYDNALLLQTLAEAFQTTKNENYKTAIHHITDYLQREMMTADGGFYSAEDADSEGVEGKYYVWTKTEIEIILETDAPLYCEFYNVTEEGNWEEKNILNHRFSKQDFAKEKNIAEDDFSNFLINCNQKLLHHRSERIKPQLDNKISMSWNALLNNAFSQCYKATGDLKFKTLAEKNIDFLIAQIKEEVKVPHIISVNKNIAAGFLEDYAYLIEALISFYEISGNEKLVLKANQLAEFVFENFDLPDSPFFSFTQKNQTDVIIQKPEIYDGATPAANSVFVHSLLKLGLIFENEKMISKAKQQIVQLKSAIMQYPSSFGNWALAAYFISNGITELTLLNETDNQFSNFINPNYFPDKIVLHFHQNKKTDLPILKHLTETKTALQWCSHQTCQPFCFNESDFLKLYQQHSKT